MENKQISQARNSLENYLQANFHKDGEKGYWPYKPNGQSSTEATAWCGIALRKNKDIAQGIALFIADTQLKDGGWSTSSNTGSSDWATGPALLCFRTLLKEYPEFLEEKKLADCLHNALHNIAESRVSFYPVVAKLMRFMIEGPSGLQYARGWPWDPGCFHWVEPTAYCLMSLKVPGMPEQDLYKEVTKYADKFLLEHACKDGGWNHGNHLSLGTYLPPYRLTTAEALLALQDNRQNAAIERGLAYLQSQTDSDSSSLSLAWSVLALNAFDKPIAKETSFLLARQAKAKGKGHGPNLMTTAMVHLAYSAILGDNLLQIQTTYKG
ncbi:MAG: hypothetical protein SFY67_07710 [Candidatus Melainabacteria bacterium]|nr:hypothetical protein [Candidatus Melainabacteria bacterium]